MARCETDPSNIFYDSEVYGACLDCGGKLSLVNIIQSNGIFRTRTSEQTKKLKRFYTMSIQIKELFHEIIKRRPSYK